MKQCPYCAKQIQEEAVVCPHCERALESPKVAETQEEKKAAEFVRPSVWLRGAMGAAAFTVLVIFAAVLQPSDPLILAKKILFITPINFLFFWLICTFIVWARRQAAKSTESKAEPRPPEVMLKQQEHL